MRVHKSYKDHVTDQAEKEIRSLDDLKTKIDPGFLIYTDAKETYESKEGSIEIRGDGRKGIDLILIEIGFRFDPNRCYPKDEMFYMDREKTKGVLEVLRYHPFEDFDYKFLNNSEEIRKANMQTRIDFFGSKNGDSVHDVVKVLLDNDYHVLVPPLNRLVDRVFHFIPGKEYSIETINL